MTLASLLQSPNRKKALTAQRTFDSEGESNHPGCVIAPFDFRSQTCFLFLPPPLFCCRGGAVPELPGEGPAQRLGRGVQGTQTRQRDRGAVPAHSHLLEPAQRGQAELSRPPHIYPRITSLHLAPCVGGALECSRSEECCHIQSGCRTYPSSHCLPLPLMLFIREDGSGGSSCGWAGSGSDLQDVSEAPLVFKMFLPELR